MARRRRNYARARRYVGKARGGGGSMKPIIDGIMAGAAGQFLAGKVGGYGHPLATLGIGYFRNNVTLKTEGARELGAMLVSQFTGGGNGGNGGLWN